MRVCFFGDSICQGLGDHSGGGWVERLNRFTPEHQFINLGVPAQTLSEILARCVAELKARKRTDLEMGIVLMGGLNDLSRLKDGVLRIPLKTIKKQVVELIHKLKECAKLIVIGPCPFNERVNPAFHANLNQELFFSNERISQISNHYEEVCGKFSIPYFPIYDQLKNDKTYQDALAHSDYIHPNDQGYQQIANVISKWPNWTDFLHSNERR